METIYRNSHSPPVICTPRNLPESSPGEAEGAEGVRRSLSNPFPQSPTPTPTEKGGDARVRLVLMCADSCSLDAGLLRRDEHGEITQQTIIRRLFADVSVIVPPLRAERGMGRGEKTTATTTTTKSSNNIGFIYISPDWRICFRRQRPN